jgi:serine/threonine-protein kinase
LRHPNVLRVYDWGENAGSPYLVMELLEGASLRALLDRGSLLSSTQATAIGAQAAHGLDYAHRRGLVHRDVKPANLIFDDEGRLSVADFGLARALAEATWTEPAGAVVGTARYAAPEQVRGENLDAKADVYALALVLVEATTGVVPFAADTTLATLMARVERPLTLPGGLGALGPILEAAGTVDPAERLDAARLARALDELGARLPPAAPLPLAGIADSSDERELSPTALPGVRPQLFDIDELDGWVEPGSGDTGAPEAETAVARARPAPPAGVPVRSHEGAAAGRGRAAEAGAGSGAALGLGLGIGSGPGVGSGAGLESGPGVGSGAGLGSGPGRQVRVRRRWPRVAGLLALVVVLAGGGAAGWLTLRSTTPSHPVPALRGLAESDAARLLAPLHLQLAVTGRPYDAAAKVGTILSQAPAGGRLREGRAVSVTVSAGPRPIPVPQVSSLTKDDATTVVTRSGLKVGAVTSAASMTVPAGLIVSSHPDTGTLLPGQSIDLVVSTGKPTVAVPVLQGPTAASYAAAQAALAAVQLPSTPSEQFSDTVLKGQIITTAPPPGTVVTVGTPVTVEVSKGPDLVAVPAVTGDSISGATHVLTNNGFQVTGVIGNPTATVTGTRPSEGTLLHRGAAIQLVTG